MQTPLHYYVLRVLLGAAEAGLFPGILLYLTFWVPASRRARFTALFMAAIPISGVLGGPLAGIIMDRFSGLMGMQGWQWLFIVEGLPAVFLGFVAYRYLHDKPDDSHWLTAEEKQVIREDLAADVKSAAANVHQSFRDVLRSPRFYILAAPGFALMVSTGGIFFWLPTILKDAGIESIVRIGVLSAVPFFFAFVAQYLVARHSDQRDERRLHAAIPLSVSAVGWCALPFVVSSASLSLVCLTLATAGTFAAMGPYWTLPGRYLRGAAAAGGIALITTLAGVGNFFSPVLVGWLVDITGKLVAGQFYFSALTAIAALVLFFGIRETTLTR